MMLALVVATLGITHDDWHHPHRPRCPDARAKGGLQVKDFDEFCDKHNIQPDELGVAFAEWMSQAIGWNGDYKEVTDETR